MFLEKIIGKNSGAREKYAATSCFVGIVVNFFLAALKAVIGVLSNSIAIIADAANNLSDIGTSVMMLIGFRLTAKPADEEHPFGHGRAEYLVGLLVSVVMIFFGAQIFLNSVKIIIWPEDLNTDRFTLLALILAVAAKFFLGVYYRRVAKKIESPAIHAASDDSFSDCLGTVVIILSVAIYSELGVNIDGVAGILISCPIVYGGLMNLKSATDPLLGERPAPELIDGIKKAVNDFPEILGSHDLIVHGYGVGKNFVSLHVEMPDSMTLSAAHEVVDKLERRLKSEFNIFVTIHVDPVLTDDKDFDELHLLTENILTSIDEKLSSHDFRVTPYKNGKKLIFDVAVPQNFYLTDREIRRQFHRKLMNIYPLYRAAIQFDHQYC